MQPVVLPSQSPGSTEETKPNTKKANNTRTKQCKLKQENTQNAKPKQIYKNHT